MHLWNTVAMLSCGNNDDPFLPQIGSCFSRKNILLAALTTGFTAGRTRDQSCSGTRGELTSVKQVHNFAKLKNHLLQSPVTTLLRLAETHPHRQSKTERRKQSAQGREHPKEVTRGASVPGIPGVNKKETKSHK